MIVFILLKGPFDTYKVSSSYLSHILELLRSTLCLHISTSIQFYYIIRLVFAMDVNQINMLPAKTDYGTRFFSFENEDHDIEWGVVIGELTILGRKKLIYLARLLRERKFVVGMMHDPSFLDECIPMVEVSRDSILSMFIACKLHMNTKQNRQGKIIRMRARELIKDILLEEAMLSDDPVKVVKLWYQKGLNFKLIEKLLEEMLLQHANQMFLHKIVSKIQKACRLAIANPNTELCKRRLMREFNILSSDNT